MFSDDGSHQKMSTLTKGCKAFAGIQGVPSVLLHALIHLCHKVLFKNIPVAIS
jgi:hypothetical protein